MSFASINQIAFICRNKNISDIVICPGSRCAPLTLAFTRQPGLSVRTFSDERSAAFIALGMAQHTGRPSVLVCTSGTAAYNFSPAVAEAYFSQVPLLVFTADRPREWIGQYDGQTIFQPAIYGLHAKKSFELPQEYDHTDDMWAINRIVNEAINLAMEEPRGPVHVNVPLREPLYPGQRPETAAEIRNRIIETITAPPGLTAGEAEKLSESWDRYHNVLMLAGQFDFDQELVRHVEDLCHNRHIPLIAEVTGNLHNVASSMRHADAFLGCASPDLKKSLQPDLLITFGRNVVSKHLKQFLRQHPAKEHWHIQPAGAVADTFQQLTKVIRTTPVHFMDLFGGRPAQDTFENQKQQNYFKLWEIEERRTRGALSSFLENAGLGELSLVHEVMNALPSRGNLHLANSLSVRYANYVGLSPDRTDVKVYANRGTSGIDGCTSTAVGHALSGPEMNVLITGDVAFFYDRNAFWHNYELPNLRIVLLNNHGGAIFKMVDGAEDLPESDAYFVTEQKLNAKKLCEEFGFEHIRLDNKRKMVNALKNFFDDDKAVKVLELENTATAAKSVLDDLKQHLKKRYEL